MSKTTSTSKHVRIEGGATIIDPKARLDAWERARGLLTKSGMQKVLRQMHIMRREWNRISR